MIETNKPPLFWAALLILLFGTIISVLTGPQNEDFAPPEAAIWIAPPPPQGGGYAYRRTITIDHTKVPNTDQSNFPLLISGTYSYLATVANGGNVQNANGYDVIFSSDIGCATKLDHEVQSYSATAGAVNYWVRVSSLSHTTDTTIYLCYGNSAITTDQSNKTGVWDSNFKAVYHLEDQAASTTVSDSSANGSNGVNAANTSGKTATGILGRALTYNGTSDNTSTGVTQTSSFTWECWFKLTDWTTQTGSSNYSTLMAGTYASGGALLMLWKDSAYVVQFASDNAGGVTSGTNSVAPGAWHHAAYTRTGNSGTYSLYFDGVLKGQVASGTLSPSTAVMLARRSDATAQALNGLLDETRISNVARSADWIKTEYNNQSSPGTFYTISATSCCDSSTSRLDPLNVTGGGGENPLSRNFNWNLPLVGLPGRAGLDLSLTLSYNSLVWTKSGSYISFDDDRGFPSPGFRLGFPVIQPLYFNSEVGKYAFLLIGTDGSRTELRQVGSSSLYEAADSSHLLLDATTMVLRTTDDTQLSYTSTGSQFDCTQIKDRNGNYLTITYTTFGRIDTVTDTLGRNVKFNYDVNGLLTSITQVWNQDPSTHNWATFDYSDTTLQTNFTGLTVLGPATIKTLSKVTLADGSHYDFTYSTWGQVWKVSNFAPDNHVINYRSYNLPQTAGTAYTDCPRFTERHDWAENWNQNISGIEQEAITTFAAPVADSWTMPDNTAQSGTRAQVTAPDLTSNKIYFIGAAGTASGWQRGLPALVNTYDSSGVLQRQAMTTWTQDNTAVSYPLNPRVTETNIYDPAGNRARVQMTYQLATFTNGTSCQLPRDTYEYAADASTKLRSTRTDYNTSSTYTDRRIIGLVSEKSVYEGDVNNGGTLASKVGFFYDNDNGSSSIQGTDAPVQHDNTNYTASFVTGRANLSSVRRYNVNNIAQFTTTSAKYNTAGSVVSSTDASGHVTQIGYVDSFSDNGSRTTLAYPTKLTDPDGYYSTSKYNFDFGGLTYRQTPPPNYTSGGSQPPGPEQTTTYDSIGRLQQITNVVNNVDSGHTRYVYFNTATRVDTYATIQDNLSEAHSFQIRDGAGRVIGTATDHPGSDTGYSGQRFVYDTMGRGIKTSNPTEISIGVNGALAQWTPAGDDESAGWIYTQQSYDWKGRPLVTTNQDGTTKTASYTGCGCAGGEVVTLTDEGTVINGVPKYRQQKIYSDVLGRTIKTEVLNWSGGSVYSATVNTYNALDQVKQVRQYAGPEGGQTYQDTTMAYDGYGRLQSEHVPEQDTNTATVWTYNADDTANTITDARGAVTTYGYSGTNRHLVKQITRTLAGSPTITSSFIYDAVGNRVSMTDSLGSVDYSYNQLGQLAYENRGFSGVGSFSINYTYNLAGQLMSVTDPFGASFSYTRDTQGRLKQVTGSPYAGTTSYVSDVKYRAWGAAKSVSYNGSTSTIGFNARMQPTQFRLTVNVNGASIIREDYSYFPDSRLSNLTDLDDTAGTNPPVSLRFLSRAYLYDHAGRVGFAYGTGNAGQGVPFNQTYVYDEFDNMTTRSGAYYNYNFSGPATDTATYTNDRRSNWTYNAEGQVLSTPLTSTDRPRTMTYNAADRMVTTVQSNQFNTVTYSASYDGDGQLVYETSNTSPGTSSASYIVRSTVLGEVLTRLDQFGNKLITHVPAEGLLFATQRSSGGPGAYVDMTFRNPLGITETSKAVYDPLGNYIPFQAHGDPRPPAGSYNSGSMSGLSSSQADPSSFGVGCIMDGMPTNCRRVMQAIHNGQADGVFMFGLALTPTITRLMMGATEIPPQSRPIGPPIEIETSDGKGVTFTLSSLEITRHFIIAPGMQDGFEQNPQNPLDETGIEKTVLDAIASKPCVAFANAILGAQKRKGLGNLGQVANLFFKLSAPHFTRNRPPDSTLGIANPIGRISTGTAQIYLIGNDPTLSANQQMLLDADNTIGELFHLAARGDYYTDEELARVANSVYGADAYQLMNGGKPLIDPRSNIFDKRYIPNKRDPNDREHSFSRYFHTIQHLYCTATPGMERGVGFAP